MNNPKTPFHAVSDYDAFGQPPFIEKLPREEEDFATRQEARDWLAERGGTIEKYCSACGHWHPVERVAPQGETAHAC